MKRLVSILPIALICLSANTWAAGPDAGGSKATAGTSDANFSTSARATAENGTESPARSGVTAPVQESIVDDLKRGKQACSDLTGKPRAACEARAAATAEAPRGRGAADPTGTGNGAPSKSGGVK